MARPVRIDVPGGWYHITARGIERRAIFVDDRDHAHFLELLEEMVGRYGVEVHAYALIRGRVALGSQAFLSQMKAWAGRLSTEQPGRRQVLKRVAVADIVRVVERQRGRLWAQFANCYGDWGRELVIYLARQRSGLTLREIGAQLGLREYKTVSKAIQRFAARLPGDPERRRVVKECLAEMSNVET